MGLVKDLTVADSKEVALVHQHAFRNFFLSRLGIRFLTQFYKALIRRKDTVCRAYWNDAGRLGGFYVANQDHRGFYKNLSTNNFTPFFLSSFHVFLFNPLLLFRLMKSFQSNSHSHPYVAYPYLLSICVAPDSQNKGIGKILIDDLIVSLTSRGFRGIYLTTDAADNASTNAFYLQCGFVEKQKIYQGAREMNVYFKELVPMAANTQLKS